MPKQKEATITVSTQGNETTIKVAWDRRKARLGRVLVGIFLFLMVMMLFSGVDMGESILLLIAPPLFFIILGIYFVRLYSRNFTHVVVSPKELYCFHAPVWYPGKRSFPLAEVAGIEVRHRSQRSNATQATSSKLHFYDPYVLLKNRPARILINFSHFNTQAQAQDFVDQLEAAMAAQHKAI